MERRHIVVTNSGVESDRDIDEAQAVIDSNGRVAEWSHAAQFLLGYQGNEVIGHPVTSLLPMGERLPLPGPDRCQGDRTGELRLRHRDGRAIPVIVRLTELLNAEGPSRWHVTAVPVEEVRRREVEAAVLGHVSPIMSGAR
ncbi:PAS domain S-box protein [Kitasatospora sp. NPDC001159]